MERHASHISDHATYRRPRAVITTILAIAVLTVSGCVPISSSISPPGQPASGPGGADYKHAAVTAQKHGEGNAEYWLFFPDDPQPETAPLVIFLHGWSATDPDVYGAWISHIVRKGHIVLYPRYQQSILTPVGDMLTGASSAITDAWTRVTNDGPVRPRTDKLVWIGHSLGATFCAIFAAQSDELSLPPPAALVLTEPGGETHVRVGDLSSLPSTTRILLVVGENDRIAGSSGADALLEKLGHMPPENVEEVIVQSDDRPTPPLIADHFAPLAVQAGFPPTPTTGGKLRRFAAARGQVRAQRLERYTPDALDFYGFWKLSDGMLDDAFRGNNLEYAFGDTSEQRFMGRLSDGLPVTPLVVTHPLEAP